MSSIWDLYYKLERTDNWILLYYLKELGREKRFTSKYIAECIQKPHRKVVSGLVIIQRLQLVEKMLSPYWRYDKYPRHHWQISEEGLSFIDSRKSLDTGRHFMTLQRLNTLTDNPRKH